MANYKKNNSSHISSTTLKMIAYMQKNVHCNERNNRKKRETLFLGKRKGDYKNKNRKWNG